MCTLGPMRTRILYLDDSGKPDALHQSGAVVIAGFAIDSDLYATLSRRVIGAKSRFYPSRGGPQSWEVKSTDIVNPTHGSEPTIATLRMS
jgi:hypothetical protein